MKRLLLTSIIMLSALSLIHAQPNWQPATIVTVLPDTLYGDIDYQDWRKNPTQITFRNSISGSVNDFEPNQIISFEVSDQRYASKYADIDQTPITINGFDEITPLSIEATVFMRVIMKGEVSLYEHRGDRINFFIERDGDIEALISHEFAIYRNSRLLVVDSNKEKFIEQLRSLPYSCKERLLRRINYTRNSILNYLQNCSGLDNEFEIDVSKESHIIKHGPIFTARTSSYFQTVQSEIATTAFGQTVFVKETIDLSFDAINNFGFGYMVEFISPDRFEKNSYLLSFTFSSYSFESEDTFNRLFQEGTNNFVYRGLGDIRSEFYTLDLNFWYKRKLSAKTNAMILELGTNFSTRLGDPTLATYRSSGFGSDAVLRDYGLSTSTFLAGLFSGIGVQSDKLYLSVRANLTSSGFQGTSMRSASITTGYKF